MITARLFAPIALLADGRVLVAGGVLSRSGNTEVIVTAQSALYDPATGAWSATGSMLHTRRGHTLTRLSNGRVLAAGGISGGGHGGILTSAELCDPHTARCFQTQRKEMMR